MTTDVARCIWCARETWPEDVTIEHLLPRARGGQSRPENLGVACRRCNRLRGARPVVAFVRERMRAGPYAPTPELVAALEGLAQSESRAHADYGRRQLALLARVVTER